MILVNDGFWERHHNDAHVLLTGHRGAQVEMFAAESFKPGTASGDDTVEEELDIGDVCCWGVDLVRVVDGVAADGEAHAFRLCFVGSFSGNKACICCLAAWWELLVEEVAHGFSACRHMRLTPFGEADEFIGGDV
jgi:hypothetical protein